ncbi:MULTISPECIES: FAD-dependent oxidoreductase [unclassified Bacillus (in: firmicutes)]|uniref:FAD-dependent oxidoreductase n=1 Tax=unclassified Bacillus (in: firmicutes) TaxID=185979 RepID=UPI000E35A779|nr:MULTISPECIES: FAD dependent oxidoreductase [unclassified Bacillus (in: firmicutes)]AXR16963.1 FAD dependent oxidoreductase [Bacillus sp. CR71]AXR22658.1 FAD dependent oxidoreductase [Bacillus sp. E25]
MDNQLLYQQPKRKKALVIGAGIAGLLTARVLSSYFETVIVVEKDELPQKPSERPGTPQDFHPHRVLPRGEIIMNRFFPGYVDDLLNLGAHNIKNDKMIRFSPYGALELVIERKGAASSRALLEWTIRQRVQEIPNVHFYSRQAVTGLLASSDHKRVIGIHIQERDELKTKRTVLTDLVVDTCGRQSKLNKWLTSIGYDVPEPERLKVNFGYSTRYYKVPPHIKEKLSAISEGDPAKNVGAVGLLYIEDNIAQALLFVAGGLHYPPTNSKEYEKELDSLVTPMMGELIKELEPISVPRGFRAQESTRQHFEQMENWPSGLLVLGDAFCNFDPIYGQGMTVAAIEAEMLDTCLKEHSTYKPGFERKVLQRMQQAIEPAWWLSSIADLRWKGVEHVGAVPLKGVKFAQKYFDLYLKQAVKQANEGNSSMLQKYIMMNGLVHSPYEIINSDMLRMLINRDGSSEENELLNELGEVDKKPMQERIHELIPSFTLAFENSAPNLFSSISISNVK